MALSARTDYAPSNSTTLTITPPNGALVLVFAKGITEGGSAPPTISLANNRSLTMTQQLAVQGNNIDYSPAMKAYTLIANGTSITFTISGPTGPKRLEAFSWASGFDGASPVGVKLQQSASGPSDGAWNTTLSGAPAATSEVVATMLEVLAAGVITVDPGTGYTEIYDYNQADYFTTQTQYRTGSTSTACGWADVVVGTGSTYSNSDRALAMGLEIKAGTASGAVLQGDAADVAAATGALTTQIKAAATAADVVTATAALNSGKPLQASASDVVSATASLSVRTQFAGAAVDIVTAAATLATNSGAGSWAHLTEDFGDADAFGDPGYANGTRTLPSATYVAGRLHFVVCSSQAYLPANAALPTSLALGSATFDLVDSIVDAVTGQSLAVYRFLPTSDVIGSLVVTYPAARWYHIEVSVEYYTNPDDAGGSNGSAAVIQADHDANSAHPGDTPSVTLSAFGKSDNATFVCASAARTGAPSTYNEQAGSTKIHQIQQTFATSGGGAVLATAARLTADTTPVGAFSDSDGYAHAIAVEVKTPAVSGALNASAQDVVAATGALTTQIKAAADAASVVTVSAALTTAIKLAMAAVSNASATGALSTGVKLAAAATSLSTGSATLSGGAQLSAAAQSNASAIGALTTAIRLGASAQDVASASAAIATDILLGADAQSVASASAAIRVGVSFSAALANLASATATLSTTLLVSGSATDVVTATAAFTNYATVTLVAPLYTGKGGVLDPDFWVDSVPEAGTVLYYDPTHITITSNGEISADTNSCSAVVQFIDENGEWAQGLIIVTPGLVANAKAESTVVGQLNTAIQLIGAATALSSLTATLSTNTGLAASASSSANASASLSTGVPLTAHAAAVSQAVADMTTQVQLLAAFLSLTSASATLNGNLLLSASAQAASTAFASLTTDFQLSAIAQAASESTAALVTGVTLVGVANGVASAGAVLSTQRLFVANAVNLSTAAAFLNTGIEMSANAQGVANAFGNLLASIDLVAFAASEATATGALGSVDDIAIPQGVHIAITGSATYTRAITGSAPITVH